MRIVVSFIFFVHGFPKSGQEVASLGLIGYLVGPFEVLVSIFVNSWSYYKVKYD